jgi:hypothetical protein
MIPDRIRTKNIYYNYDDTDGGDGEIDENDMNGNEEHRSTQEKMTQRVFG